MTKRLLTFCTLILSTAGMSSAWAAEDWDAKFAGIPKTPLLTGEIGFSGVPRSAYIVGLSNSFSVGAAVTLDLGYKSPGAAGDFGIILSAPMRLSLSKGGKVETALLFEPGIPLFMSGAFRTGLIAGGGFNLGYHVTDSFTIGGGIDVPLAFLFVPGVNVLIPILIGPVAELRVARNISLTFDSKFGPSIAIAGEAGTGVGLGMNLAVGVAVAL